MKEYLSSSNYIDYKNSEIMNLAKSLSRDLASDEKIAKKCFEWVRDEIRHSADYKLNPVTCKASEVLKHRTGYCFAKSHLLAALLRANHIPAGLCYQRLSLKGNGEPYSLHGLNAVYLDQYGWYRIDARGNKPGVDAKFCPPNEKLAFDVSLKEERDLPGIFAAPLPEVIAVLEKYHCYSDVYINLPDSK